MWFLDGRTVSEVIAARKRPDPIPLKEWDRLVNPLEGAGPAAERLQQLLYDDHGLQDQAAGAVAPQQKVPGP